MKPLYINLAAMKNIQGKIVFAFVLIVIAVATGLTLGSTYEYMANKKVIKVYQNRFQELNRKEKYKKSDSKKKVPDQKELEIVRKNFVYLEGIIKKNMFSLPLLLTEIEKIKPEQLNINEIVFSENLQVVTLKGQSNFVNRISQFLIALDRSPLFRVELSKEEINGQQQIAFELILKWIKPEERIKIEERIKNPDDEEI